MVNSVQTVSWMAYTITFVNPDSNFTDNIYGLMGNGNGVPSDDIFTRDRIVETDTTTDSTIYSTAITCKKFMR